MDWGLVYTLLCMWLCVRSWLARHPAKTEITGSSWGSSHHAELSKRPCTLRTRVSTRFSMMCVYQEWILHRSLSCSCLFTWSLGSQRRNTDHTRFWWSQTFHAACVTRTLLYGGHLTIVWEITNSCTRNHRSWDKVPVHNTWRLVPVTVVHKWIRIPNGDDDHDRSRRVPRKPNLYYTTQKKSDEENASKNSPRTVSTTDFERWWQDSK